MNDFLGRRHLWLVSGRHEMFERMTSVLFLSASRGLPFATDWILSCHRLSRSQSETNHPIPAVAVNLYFKNIQREKNTPCLETVQLSTMARSLVCATWVIPICLNTHIWHTGVRNLIENNEFGFCATCASPHHQYYRSFSTFVALSNRLRPPFNDIPSPRFWVSQH